MMENIRLLCKILMYVGFMIMILSFLVGFVGALLCSMVLFDLCFNAFFTGIIISAVFGMLDTILGRFDK